MYRCGSRMRLRMDSMMDIINRPSGPSVPARSARLSFLTRADADRIFVYGDGHMRACMCPRSAYAYVCVLPWQRAGALPPSRVHTIEAQRRSCFVLRARFHLPLCSLSEHRRRVFVLVSHRSYCVLFSFYYPPLSFSPLSSRTNAFPGPLELLRGMTAADLVSLQTYSHARHFISTCVRVCGYESTPRGIDAEGHVRGGRALSRGRGRGRGEGGKGYPPPGIQPKLAALCTVRGEEDQCRCCAYWWL
ncbi:hypothetical protein B0H16DRAFT_561884 [Mycena metata]|uniref:Uncharacterized protein n=1 Tax=Mycena metata TaxID=1033252 RepID=A0AAD7H5U1_9AGAR|nr:hypothetical protein B0H16DRAFT_561884 [Mycena metata]